MSSSPGRTTFSIVPERPVLPAIEHEILDEWRKNDSFKKSVELSKGRPVYSFYDGPPFATGLPHYGHILAGTIKDVVTRYFYQSGYHVPRRFGWDCHGLPVEYEIDQALNIKSRSEIVDKIGIDVYNEKCRSVVMRYANEWRETIERVGRWIDFDNDYKTLNPSFMETVWWVFKSLFDKGLVYRDFKVMPYSTACATPLSNFEAGQNYKDVSDPSITVSFPLLNDPDQTEILAWTTTPWTLPSNLALCVHPELTYVKFRVTKLNRVFLVAQCRLQNILKEMKVNVGKDFTKVLNNGCPEIVTILQMGIQGSSLKDLKYKPIFDFYAKDEYWASRAFRVLVDSYVTSDTGTGIVHNAPAFGEDDFRVCHAYGILEKGGELPCPVDDSGFFTEPVNTEGLLGVHVKEADKKIKMLLKESNRLLINESIIHPYPHCWRSDKPLIYKAVPSWFVKVEELKSTMLRNNTETRWVPHYVQEGRFHNWLADARDWCISRNRFWGTPLPLWVSSDYQQMVCIGSIAELQKYTDKPITDLHRHFIDDIVIPDPRGEGFAPLKRVEEVFDCWFESGSMPYAQVHYPFENKDSFEKSFPADFVGEGLDQTRGWFYTLSILGAALFNKAPFKNLIVNGLVLAADGKKMSKRLRNYPPPMELVERLGADALRLYLVSSPVVRAESVKFKEESVKEIVKTILLPWYHSFRFLTQEVTRYELGGVRWNYELDQKHMNLMDHWILSLTNTLIKFFHKEMQNYRLYTALPKLLTFLDQLTNWYVRLNRDRMRGNPKEEESGRVLSVLFDVLTQVTRLLAPFTPFLADYIYRHLRSGLPEGHPAKVDCVHFTMLPQADETLIKTDIEVQIALLQDVVVLGRQLRDKRRLKIKTPLRRLTVVSDDAQTISTLQVVKSYIQEELNCLEVELLVEKDRIELSANPNLKLLGQRLGSQLKALAPKIKALTHEQLKSLEVNGSITIDEVEVSIDEVWLSRAARGVEDNEDQAVECNSQILLIADLTMTDELIERAMIREIATKIQKLRKEDGLQVDDEVITTVTGKTETVKHILENKKHLIEDILRRRINEIVVTSDFKLRCERDYEDYVITFHE